MADYGFSIDNAKDMFGKLGRELKRFKKDQHWQPDHAINFAITAWHMTDWVFGEISEQQRKTVLGTDDLRNFQESIRAQCDELLYCYDIARGSKHLEIDRNPTPVVQSTDVSSSGGTTIMGLGVCKIRLPSGTSERAVDVFEKAFEFWENYLRMRGLLPPQG